MVTIRSLEQGDTDRLRDMLLVCSAETQRKFCPIGNFWSGGGTEYIYRLKYVIGGEVYVVVDEEGLFVGFGYHYSGESEGIAYFGILIADPHQRMGYGTSLLDCLEESAKKSGFISLRTSGGIYEDNFIISMFEKRGYNYLHHLGSTVMMEKRL